MSILNFATIPNSLVGKSIYTGKTAREYIQHDMVLSFIQNDMGISNDYTKKPKHKHTALLYPNEQIQIEKYSGMYNRSSKCIELSYSTPAHGYGRIEPPMGLSLSKLHRPTRHALAKDRYVDIDMVNCHIHYFAMVGQALGIKCEAISYYATNPKEVRDMIMDQYKIDKDTAKNLPIRLCYGGDYSHWMKEYGLEDRPYLEMVLKMERELKEIGKRIYDANPNIRNALLTYNPDKYRDAGKLYRGTISAWAQTIERLCQETAIWYLVSKRGFVLEDIIPSQDGFMILKEFHYEGIIDDITQCVEQLGIPIRWAEKAFDEAIIIPPYDLSKVSPITVQTLFPTADKVIVPNEQEVADMVYEIEKHNLVISKSNGLLCLYIHNEWISNDPKSNILGHVIGEVIRQYYDWGFHLLNAEHTKHRHDDVAYKAFAKNKMEPFVKQKKSLFSDKLNKAVRSKIMGVLLASGNTVEFDTQEQNDCLISFKNGCYDLRSNIFRKRSKYDYITQSLNYNYKPRQLIPPEVHKAVRDIFRQIQPDPEQARMQLSYLYYALSGNTSHQVFKMNIGPTGGNGKSTEAAIHMACFPQYSTKLPSKFFDKDYATRHKDLAKMITSPIRFAIIEEPSTKRIDTGLLKDFVDGRRLPVQIMYGTSALIRFVAKLLFASNFNLNFGEADGGIQRRALFQQYNSKFLEKNEAHLINPEIHYYPKKEYLMEEFNNDDYKLAYFHMLLEHKQLYIPTTAIEDFKETVLEQDKLLELLSKHYEFTLNDNDKLHRSDVLQFCEMNGWTKGQVWAKLKTQGCLYYDSREIGGKKGVWFRLKKRPQEQRKETPIEGDTDNDSMGSYR